MKLRDKHEADRKAALALPANSAFCQRSKTLSGKVCQNWNVQSPNAHNMQHSSLGNHNYCRNPDGSEYGAWCYIASNSNRKSGYGVRWEYCYGGSFSRATCNLLG